MLWGSSDHSVLYLYDFTPLSFKHLTWISVCCGGISDIVWTSTQQQTDITDGIHVGRELPIGMMGHIPECCSSVWGGQADKDTTHSSVCVSVQRRDDNNHDVIAAYSEGPGILTSHHLVSSYKPARVQSQPVSMVISTLYWINQLVIEGHTWHDSHINRPD